MAARTAAVLNFPNCTRIVITYTYFLTISCIGSVVEMKLVEMFLAKVLRFCTGSEYPPTATTLLQHALDTNWPLASTCVFKLILLTNFNNNFENCRDNVNHGGFVLL